MDLFFSPSSTHILSLALVLLLLSRGVFGATFTFQNKCDYTIWPGILANAGSPSLDTTGFELREDTSRTFQAPTGWSGRFWGRTGCKFSGSGSGSCETGDCGSGQIECNGAGAAPPATLAEFTLGSGGSDFYDVSLVDGYNVAMIVEVSGGSGMCATTGCVNDLNRQCPAELRAEGGQGCKSACEAFGSPEYCCSGAYNSPAACKPSVYSEMFKLACPRSYSYAYDDPTSTFTCTGADYTVTFCPSMPSQKASRDTSPPATIDSSTTTGDDGSMAGSTSGSGSEPNSGLGYGPGPGTGSGTMGTGLGSGSEAMLADGSWLAGLAMGDSTRILSPLALHSAALCFILFFIHLLVSLSLSHTWSWLLDLKDIFINSLGNRSSLDPNGGKLADCNLSCKLTTFFSSLSKKFDVCKSKCFLFMFFNIGLLLIYDEKEGSWYECAEDMVV